MKLVGFLLFGFGKGFSERILSSFFFRIGVGLLLWFVGGIDFVDYIVEVGDG